MTASEALEALRQSAGVDLGYFVGFSREPDGRVTWVTISKMSAELGVRPMGATVDDMEDAKIAAIESIYLRVTKPTSRRGGIAPAPRMS